MSDTFDSELRMAVAEGLLSREEAEALREEALRLGRPPLELLVERGKLSEDSLASLRKESQEQTRTTQGPADDTVTVQRPSREVPVLQVSGDPGAFPVPGWERYQFMRLLGQGGMGRVFLAHDPRLRRDVALKFVRDDDPDATRRFIFEARAQARVVHESVCQVYEVGEVQGKPFIAMQHIDGLPLNQLAQKLTPEQKAMVLRDAAEGVHAAHRVGLIHRDLKPSNIMVERPQDGSLKCYVMDFGLARDWKEGMTASGSVLGTPHYMAPEQARGEVTRLDRRADVYSLGATLYHLLTGTYPIHGSNHLEVLSNIPTVEPRPPRALDKDIPVDLEAIVLKCLEKERSARYDSARALAEDLDRFLNGEPVHARPTGLWYRLRKKARRHRGAMAMGSVTLALVSLAVGDALQSRREKADNGRLVREHTATERDIDEYLLRSYLIPPHDIRPARARIREWMDVLKALMLKAGDQGQGPGNYALGKGYLALGEKALARQHLEEAWARRHQEPAVAYALAVVLGQLYQEQLLEMDRQYRQRLGKRLEGEPPAEEWRKARRQKLQEDFRDPALEKLRWLEEVQARNGQNTQGEPAPPAYVKALLAFYEDRLDDALEHLKTLGQVTPWFYEDHRLRGDIFRAFGIRYWNQGKTQEARDAFEASRRAYGEATKIGQSDPTLYHALAQLARTRLGLEISSEGAEVEPLYNSSLDALKLTLAIDPDHAGSKLLEARVHSLYAWHQDLHDQQPVQQFLERALEIAKTVRELKLQPPETRLELGWVYWQLAQRSYSKSQDPREQLHKALEAVESVAPKDRDPEAHQLLGRIYKTRADYEDTNKDKAAAARSSLPYVNKAIASFSTSLEMDASQISTRVALATAYLMRALNRDGADPRGDLEQARKTLEEARALNPAYVMGYFYEGRVHRKMAERLRRQGGDPRRDYRKALELFQEGLRRDNKLTLLRYNAAQILTELAREEWERGASPFPLLEEARTLLTQASAADQNDYFFQVTLGDIQATHAEYRVMHDEEPGPSTREAEAALVKASVLEQERPTPRALLGWLHHTLAAAALEHGRDPGQHLARALAEFEQTQKNKSSAGINWLQRGRALELQARWKEQRNQDPTQDFQQAEDAFHKAHQSDPENQEFRLALGRFYWEKALWKKKQGGDPGPLVAQGLAWADGLLRERDPWQNARVLRALLLLLANHSASPQEPLQVREELTRMLKGNPNLERQWKQHVLRLP